MPQHFRCFDVFRGLRHLRSCAIVLISVFGAAVLAHAGGNQSNSQSDPAIRADNENPVASSAAARQLNLLLSPMTRFTADFEQTIRDIDGVVIQTASGRTWLAKPGRFRWQIREPYAQLLVSDGEKLWLYDPDLEQVTVRPVDERLQQTPARLLSGDIEALLTHYHIEQQDQDGQQQFVLQPNDPEGLFTALRFRFDGLTLVGLSIEDSLGQETTVAFSNVRRNGTIDPNQFTFEPPPGTDVLYDNP